MRYTKSLTKNTVFMFLVYRVTVLTLTRLEFRVLINRSIEKVSLATAHGEVVGGRDVETCLVSARCPAWTRRTGPCVGLVPPG